MNTALRICYEGYGSPLILLLEDNGIITECSIKTLETDSFINFDFDIDKLITKIIMKVNRKKNIYYLDNNIILNFFFKVRMFEGSILRN